MDEWMDGWTDGRTDGRTDDSSDKYNGSPRACSLIKFSSIVIESNVAGSIFTTGTTLFRGDLVMKHSAYSRRAVRLMLFCGRERIGTASSNLEIPVR